MVNILKNSENTDSSSSQFLFSLSRPVNLFSEKCLKTKNFILNLDSSNSIFEFLEPFESSRSKNQNPGKLNNKTPHQSRPKPYSRPDTEETNDSSNFSVSSSSSSSSNESGYNQTAILARLSSISSTFKSIFVRPKNSKQVDLTSIKQKPQQTPTKLDFKLNLFSTSSDVVQTDINSKLEKIISSKMIDSKPTPSVSSVSTLSTTSNLTSDSFLTPIEKQQKISSSFDSKWTCMVCLSKHKMDIKVCAICCSLKQSVKTKSQTPVATPPLKTLNSNFNPSNYLKTWTCSFCSFANDSLKIVCMNCRSSKQQQLQYVIKKDQVQLHQSAQTKRARKALEAKKSQLNTSNEENQLDEEQPVKKSKKEDEKKIEELKPCNCRCKTDEPGENLPKPVLNLLNPSQLVTPTRPPNFYGNDSEKATSLNKLTTSDKWPCSVCLVKNDADKTNCVCCTTPRDAEKQQVAKKWECSTCLVSNESDKNVCVCCMTSREVPKKGNETATTKFSELVAAANSLNPLNKVNSNISFGIKPNENGLKPIQFGSSFSIGQNLTTGGFSFGTKILNNDIKDVVDSAQNETQKQVPFELCSSTKPLETVKTTFQTNSENNIHLFNNQTKPVETQNLFGFNTPIEASKPIISLGSTSTETTKPTFAFVSNPNKTAFSFEMNNKTEKEASNFGQMLIQNQNNELVKPTVYSAIEKSAFGLPTSNSEQVKQFISFDSSNTSTEKPLFGFESAKPAFSFGPINQEKPAFGFNTSTQNSEPLVSSFPTTIGTNNSASSALNPTLTFGSNNPKPESDIRNFGFGSTTTITNSGKSNLSFGSSNFEQVKPFKFGSNNNSDIPKTSFNFSNSIEPVKTAFSFGIETPKPSFSFAETEKSVEVQKPFSFGSNNINTSFNFGANSASNSNPFNVCSTPNSNFVFGALNNTNHQNNADSPTLSQVLSAQAKPLNRVIKKPTRRIKK